jgi:hypothetical protein
VISLLNVLMLKGPVPMMTCMRRCYKHTVSN